MLGPCGPGGAGFLWESLRPVRSRRHWASLRLYVSRVQWYRLESDALQHHSRHGQ